MKKFFALFLLMFSFIACKPISEQITVNDCQLEDVDNVSLGLTQLSLETNLLLDAENESCLDITLTRLNAELFSKTGKQVATVTLNAGKGEKPVLHRKCTQEVVIPILVEFDNPLTALTLAAMSMEDYGKRGYTISYDCNLKAGLFAKRITGEKVPVEDFVNILSK